MFGYVVINEQELKVREVGLYRSYYCGFCRELKRKYGFPGQMTLSYDMTFLIMVLCDLYDAKDTVGQTRCIAHPLGEHPTRINRYTEYAADMNLILSYYACLDDWNDEHKFYKLMLSRLLHGRSRKAGIDYGHKAAVIKDRLDRLHEAEAAGSSDIDLVAGYFGDIMAELFAVHEDEWEEPLRHMGFYLGKFIYIMDAYDDLEKDTKSGSFNPLKRIADRPDFDDRCHQILTMMISRSCEAFELLPCVENLSILRNILYSGVWTRYNNVRARRQGVSSESAADSAYHHSPAAFSDAQILGADPAPQEPFANSRDPVSPAASAEKGASPSSGQETRRGSRS